MTDNQVQKLIEAVMDADRDLARDILESHAEQHGYMETASLILEPALMLIGEKWETSGDVSLAQAYVAAKVAGDFMTRSAEIKPAVQHTDNRKGTVVIGNIEDDYHSLGRNMVSIFLEKDGWVVHDLGNDVLASDFVDKALEHQADIIAVSAMMYSTAMNIIKVREALKNQNLEHKIKLVVGGAVFKLRPDLVEEVGGDGTAPNAIKAPRIFDALYQRLREGEL